MSTKTIAVDFDGVIHKYSRGWQDGSIYDEPMEGAIENILKLQNEGYEVVILTSRENLREVEDWMRKHGVDIKATNKKIMAIAYIDDRAIRFTNWSDVRKYFT